MNNESLFYAILALTIAFALANAFVEAINAPAMNPLQQPLSAYLGGPGVKLGWLQSLAYLGFAVAMPLMAAYFGGPAKEHIAFQVAGVALALVVLTHWLGQEWPNQEQILVTIHRASAGVAFLSCTLGLYFHNEGTELAGLVWIPVIALLIVVFFWDSLEPLIVRLTGTIPDHSTLEEKGFTLPLIAVFLASLLA